MVAVLLDGVLVVDAGDEALVSDKEQGKARGLVDAAALGLDDSILNLIGHAQAVATADAIGFEKKGKGVVAWAAVECDGKDLFKAYRALFAPGVGVIAQE